MITIKQTAWESHLEISQDYVTIIVVEKPQLLWKYMVDLEKQASGDFGEFCLCKNFDEISFEKNCIFEPSVSSLSINTKKLQTALIKKCADFAISPNFEERLRRLSVNLYDFCFDVSQDTGYSVCFNEDIDIAGLFKLYSISFNDSFSSPLDKLIEYINVCVEFTKTKVFILAFLTKFLSLQEINALFNHCQYQNVILILLENDFSNLLKNSDIPFRALIIDKDECELSFNHT